jgi:ribosomal 30S subunit maturation factor RimM
MAQQNPALVVLARIGSPHGVRGALSVNQAGEHLRDFTGKKILICPTQNVVNGILSTYTVKAEMQLNRVDPAKGIPMRIELDGLTDRDVAKGLTNCLIATPLAELRAQVQAERVGQSPNLHDLWYFEIVGLEVIEADSRKPVGKITQIEDLGLNTVLTVETPASGEKGAMTLEIPLEHPNWQKVDLANHAVSISDWQIFLHE